LARGHLMQAGFTAVCLPYEAFFSLDAIVRTAWRMVIAHKRLLQWNPSGEVDRNSRTALLGEYRTMWIGPLLAVAAGLSLAEVKPAVLIVAGPMLGLWFISPAIAWWISRSIAHRRERLTADQTRFLRKLSRKTWAYFETFVGPDDHWLPPDNYQEQPVKRIAHRTSPTNMGLGLLANMAAYDFGYVSAGKLIERTTKTLHTMNTLEQYQGHFYNWYDTLSLTPLPPRYISSVDSGNLAGHLLTLRTGLLELTDHTILGTQFFEGLNDILAIINDAAALTSQTAASSKLAQLLKDVELTLRSRPTTLMALQQCFNQLASSAVLLIAGVKALNADPEGNLQMWARAFEGQCRDALDELALLVPWTQIVSSPERPDDLQNIDTIPTLRELANLKEQFLPAIACRINADPTPAQRNWLVELQYLSTVACREASARLTAINMLAVQCNTFARMDMIFCMTQGVIYSPSASMSMNAEGTLVTTICSLRKPDYPVL